MKSKVWVSIGIVSAIFHVLSLTMRSEKPLPEAWYWFGLATALGMIFVEGRRMLKAKRATADSAVPPSEGSSPDSLHEG